jgi:hypothetical protein
VASQFEVEVGRARYQELGETILFSGCPRARVYEDLCESPRGTHEFQRRFTVLAAREPGEDVPLGSALE